MKREPSPNGQMRRCLRRAAALVLAMCLTISGVALGASSVGQEPSSIVPSAFSRQYIKLSKAVVFFTGDTYATGTTVSPAIGTVWQLLSDDFYTSSVDGKEYYSVYYNNERYNVLKSDVHGDIMSADSVVTYIKTVIWNQSSFATLRRDQNIGDIQVHALQYALTQLKYYDGALDGDYGEKTEAAVRKFQRDSKLDRDGNAGPITLLALYRLVGGTSTGSGTTVTGTGTLKTTVSVNLRKKATTKSARLAVVPRSTTLAYVETYTSGGTTWYEVKYNSHTGWLMGNFVNANGSSSSGGGSGAIAIGTVTITEPGTRVRVTANGKKSGTVLSKGAEVDLIAQPTTAGGYTWYKIRTSSGLVGFVRGDCATATQGGVSPITPSTSKTFLRLPADTQLFKTEAKPSSGASTVSGGTVLQMVSTATYTKDNVVYCSLYYNNEKFNAVYDEVKAGIMSDGELSAYVLTLWNDSISTALKQELDLVGDVRVYAMQLALYVLGYYTGNLDGNFGGGSASAVRNFQRKNSLEVDSSCGPKTWEELTKQAKVVSSGGTTGGGTGTSVTDFGTINSIEIATWDLVNNSSTPLFRKDTTATVLDIETGKVFTIYRWSGGDHADCVPYTSADTKTMCDIVGFTYNSSHPTTAQLADIAKNDWPWPDFGNHFGGTATNIGSKWDRRAALLNVGGRVFCVSIYGYAHGFNGINSDAFSKAKFTNGTLFYKQNNYYGMMCVHFKGSTTHTSTTPDSKHQQSIQDAYDYALKHWPTLCK